VSINGVITVFFVIPNLNHLCMVHTNQVVKRRTNRNWGNYCVLVIPNLNHLCTDLADRVVKRSRVSKWGNYCVLVIPNLSHLCMEHTDQLSRGGVSLSGVTTVFLLFIT